MYHANNAPYGNEPYQPVAGAGYGMPCRPAGNGFALIVVLFILLIIVGTAFVKC
ncbi:MULTISPECIES: YjcZ family sporulation protein [Bacillaceae]|uniref:YjcZ family sporulation protein n=1 Tax=Bacillales TaxID=1385 RepID=UPI0023EF2678|nr:MULTISPECIES: YjcZ family sporulation protein [Bacillaceae]